MNVYFLNKHTGKRFKLISLDKATNQMVLQGEYATFTVAYDKQWLQDAGYTLVKEPIDAQQPGLQAELQAGSSDR